MSTGGTAVVEGVEVSTDHWIGGNRVASPGTFTDVSPIDEQTIAEVARGGAHEAAAAVAAARGAFAIWGAMSKEQFIGEFSDRFAALQAEKIEWSSLQAEENIAVQSLNLILRKRFSGARTFYKLILFMDSDIAADGKKEWKLYYLRGLKI
jgi:acyl-CoA reductase-like NAD-dependent aldehyde dehydrogenase